MQSRLHREPAGFIIILNAIGPVILMASMKVIVSENLFSIIGRHFSIWIQLRGGERTITLLYLLSFKVIFNLIFNTLAFYVVY